jgi:hypothetical protein
MTTKFKIQKHHQRNVDVVELWFRGEMIGQITPVDPDKAGVRVITKHVMDVHQDFMVTQVDIKPMGSGRSMVESIPRMKLITILNMMPEEAFGWFVMWASGMMTQYPDGLGGFQDESRLSIEALRAAGKEYIEKNPQ